ncbi:MAG TPA: hypothetical protein VI382_10795 [Candidatus Manganitrophaceae bacterium]|nr:hypothetical protein [Candidatus Manganitrophaceae bacterium]
MKGFEKNFRRVVWAGALYDLIVVAPYAFPVLVDWQIEFLTGLHKKLGLAGSIPPFEPTHLFFLNLFGSVVVVWAALRLVRPEPLFGLFDGFGRALFSAWMLYYLIVWQITYLVVVFLIPEMIWGIVQLGGYWIYKKQSAV